MPPATRPMPNPQSRDRDALEFLEHHGIFARVPPIRARDIEALHAPFRYYLTRRLGLLPAFAYSMILSRGSWFHVRFEQGYNSDDIAESGYRLRLKSRLTELREICKTVGVSQEKTALIVDREQTDAMTALAWHNASRLYRHPTSDMLKQGWAAYINNPKRRILCAERLFSATAPGVRTPLICQPDRLVYDPEQNHIIIIDPKTTAKRIIERMNGIPFAFSTRHYCYIIRTLLEDGVLQSEFGLPSSCKLWGMMHLAIRKPLIQLGMKDRPYWWESTGKKTGVSGTARFENDQWQTCAFSSEGELIFDRAFPSEEAAVASLHEATGKKPTKEYDGEPSLTNYQQRCEDWFTGKGDYASDADDRIVNPPVGISRVPLGTCLDAAGEHEYLRLLRSIDEYAQCQPHPENFPRTESCVVGDKLDLFCAASVQQWPTIMREEFISQDWRGNNAPEMELDNDGNGQEETSRA